jgi:hypothetical protein
MLRCCRPMVVLALSENLHVMLEIVHAFRVVACLA